MEDAAEHGETTHAPDTLRVGLATRPNIKKRPQEAQNLVARINTNSIISSSPKNLLASLNKKTIGNIGRR
jgi:hypothetical protein